MELKEKSNHVYDSVPNINVSEDEYIAASDAISTVAQDIVSVTPSEAPVIIKEYKSTPEKNNLKTFEGRLKYGKDAEEIVLRDLLENNIDAKKTEDLPNWNSNYDLIYGDIEINIGGKKIKVDVKRGYVKDDVLIGTVTKHSKENFKGDYYLFTKDLSLVGAKLLRARSVKSYMKKVESDSGLETTKSGDPCWHFKLNSMKTAIDYSKWVQTLR